MSFMNCRILGLIPARGGSKGIPRKNLVELSRKPLISYTIQAAKNSRYIDDVFVSTEDKEIATLSRSFGVEIIDRPKTLAGDNIPSLRVIEHAIDYLAKKGFLYDVIVLLQPTSPLRNSHHIDEALSLFFKSHFDSVVSVCQSHYLLWKRVDHRLLPVNHSVKKRVRRQDMPREFFENGAIYITTCKLILRDKKILGGRIGLYIMDKKCSVDIDDKFDLWLCEKIMADNKK